jgi:hypothetical protein
MAVFGLGLLAAARLLAQRQTFPATEPMEWPGQTSRNPSLPAFSRGKRFWPSMGKMQPPRKVHTWPGDGKGKWRRSQAGRISKAPISSGSKRNSG